LDFGPHFLHFSILMMWLRKLVLFFQGLALLFVLSTSATELLPPGFRPLPLGVHALVGAKVIVKPGQTLDAGTIIVRDGIIEAVGTNLPVPADARVWDLKGMTVYAGFIEPYVVLNATNPPISTTDVEPISNLAGGGVKFYGAPGSENDMGNTGPGYELLKVTPESRAVTAYSPREKAMTPFRELGFTAGVVAPAKGILRGSSALVSFGHDDPNRLVIRPDLFQHIVFETHDDDARAYPGSLMGVIAAVRQAFFDAQHYGVDRADYEKHPQGRKAPEYNPSLEALAPVLARKTRVVFEPGSALMDDRAAQLARELGFDFSIVSCGQEWRRPDLARQTGATFIVPVNFPSVPKLPNEEDWQQITLDQLRTWDWAPENPAVLRHEGLQIALTTYGLSDRKSFRKNLRLALDRGLDEDDALAALTVVPARLCGVENQLGTIETNKLADLVVVDGKSYFDPDAKVRAVWIDGKYYPAEEAAPKTEEPKPAVEATTPPKEEPEKYPQPPSVAEAEKKPEASATNAAPVLVTAPKPEMTNSIAMAETRPAAKKENKKDALRALQKTRVAHSPSEGRGPITNLPTLLIRNATIWTCGPAGVLTNAQMLISNGKILGVGNLGSPPTTAAVIDANGENVTPGVIDCHSHSFVLGLVNESTLPSTAMVRIRDVINSETENFYEQLAGGVTAANVLHGSANPIGGQNCVIKLRNGATPEELIFANAPQGIKFALGENVKQSNWGEKFVTRFPQTRMGVETFYENRFTAGQQYLKEWQDYSNRLAQASSAGTSAPVPPRRDLELEAIGEILQGKRWIHCHAYRQDEMLMLLRLTQKFGVRIGSFQHVLEGYKIADELAAGGVTGSTFADWWAYKFEVYDAIPYNGSLMRERGMIVSFNSDSSDFARRLYLEAAKAVKYGGTPEDEALKFVTINPAKQLRIDPWVGSLEPGKDADFVLWSKAPLDSGTVCLQTWIEGKKYFDRALNADRVTRLKKERDDLIAKAKKIAKLSGGGDAAGDDGGKSFFQVSLEHRFDGVDRHCLDELTEGGE
jgi:imidazolonepropionase-like amidohydrolase